MEARKAAKTRRHKKRKSRTQVFSGDSSGNDSDHGLKKPAHPEKVRGQPATGPLDTSRVQDVAKTTEAEISAEFTKYIMHRATLEFADDLNAIRSAEDFKGAVSVPILVNALQQGTSTFTIEEQKRVVLAKGEGTSG